MYSPESDYGVLEPSGVDPVRAGWVPGGPGWVPAGYCRTSSTPSLARLKINSLPLRRDRIGPQHGVPKLSELACQGALRLHCRTGL